MQIFVQCFVARICRMQIAHREWPSGNKSIQTTEKAQNVINLVLNSFFFFFFGFETAANGSQPFLGCVVLG